LVDSDSTSHLSCRCRYIVRVLAPWLAVLLTLGTFIQRWSLVIPSGTTDDVFVYMSLSEM